jgi:hypothetical protein
MFNAQIQPPTKEILQEDNSEFLSVPFDIYQVEEGGKPVLIETKRFGFPLDKPADEIEAEIKKFIDAYSGDYEAAIKNKAHDELHAQADETIKTLTGKEI